MRLTDRVLSFHPAIVTIIFVVLFFGGSVAGNASTLGPAASLLAFSVSMVAMIGPVLLWHYSLYRVASDRIALNVGHSGRRGFLFLLTIAGLLSFLVLLPMLAVFAPDDPAYRVLAALVSLAMGVGAISYFACIWAAANALTRFDERRKTVELHKTLGTFLLEFYLPIGIWVIYPRVKRLLAAPIHPES